MILEVEDHGSIDTFFGGFARERRSEHCNGNGHGPMHD